MTQPWTPNSGPDDPPPWDRSLAEGREWTDNNKQEGIAHCLMCDKRVKEDPYGLRNTWVDVGAEMCKEIEARRAAGNNDPWVMLKVFGKTNATFLQLWELIERHPERAEDGYKSKGLYQPLPLLFSFLRGQVSVPRRVVTRRGEYRYEDENDRIYIWDVPDYGGWHYERFMAGLDGLPYHQPPRGRRTPPPPPDDEPPAPPPPDLHWSPA